MTTLLNSNASIVHSQCFINKSREKLFELQQVQRSSSCNTRQQHQQQQSTRKQQSQERTLKEATSTLDQEEKDKISHFRICQVEANAFETSSDVIQSISDRITHRGQQLRTLRARGLCPTSPSINPPQSQPESAVNSNSNECK